MLHPMGFAVLVLDGDLQLRSFNDKAREMFALEAELVVGMSLGEIFPGEPGRLFREECAALLSDGRARSFELDLGPRRPSTPVKVQLTPIPGQKERVEIIVCHVMEARGGSGVNGRIVKAKQEWERAVDTMPFMVAVIDRRHRLSRINASLAKRLNIDVRRAPGLKCYSSLHGTTAPPPYCPLGGSRDSGETPPGVEVRESHLGDHVLATINALTDRNGHTVGCLFVARDLSHEERAGHVAKTSEDKMRRLLHTADHLITVQDVYGRYLYLQSVPRMDDTCSEMLGRGPFELFGEATALGMMERLQEAVRGTSPVRRITRFSMGSEVFTLFEEISHLIGPLGDILWLITFTSKVPEKKDKSAIGALSASAA